MNAAVEKATGIPKETFFGKDHRELGMPENIVSLFQKYIRKVFERGQEIELEIGLTPSAKLIFRREERLSLMERKDEAIEE